MKIVKRKREDSLEAKATGPVKKMERLEEIVVSGSKIQKSQRNIAKKNLQFNLYKPSTI